MIETQSDHRHDFDFWIGDWEVRDPEGKVVGRNVITALFDVGGVAESWTSKSGVRGQSLNVYDADQARWHQTWVDASGGLLLLDGSLVGESMVLEGTIGANRHRITWTPATENTELRQLWESSADGGENWQVEFDGRYRSRS
jgi:hypothetical protein